MLPFERRKYQEYKLNLKRFLINTLLVECEENVCIEDRADQWHDEPKTG